MIDSMNAYDANYHNFYNSHLFVCTVGAWYFSQIHMQAYMHAFCEKYAAPNEHTNK